jgi:ABC-type arginine/histidine transport system permease subunit
LDFLPARSSACLLQWLFQVGGMFYMSAFCVCLTLAFIRHLAIFHNSQENNWRIIVRLYRGPMLIALFLFFMGLNVQVNSEFRVFRKKATFFFKLRLFCRDGVNLV